MEGEKRNILLIEDDPTYGKIIKDYLNSKGFNLIWADTGEEGLQEVSKWNGLLDLIIVDMELPGMDGAEVIRWVRKLGYGVPIIILTGSSDIDLESFSEFDVYDVLEKPKAPEEIEEIIVNCFEQIKNLSKTISQALEDLKELLCEIKSS